MSSVYCLCGSSDLKGITGSDDPRTGYAQNVYTCEDCDTIIIQRVWNNSGITYIEPSGKVTELQNEK